MSRALRGAAAFAAAVLVPAAAAAQGGEARSLDLGDGERIEYRLYAHPADAHLRRPGPELAPRSALESALLLNLHLSIGDLEEAALLSNAPRRRYEVLHEYRASVGEEEFKRVFAQYLSPESRLVAEVAIGGYRLLVWELRPAPRAPSHLAGQYFMEIEGRYLVDDLPGETRSKLRRVLEAYRSGKITR